MKRKNYVVTSVCVCVCVHACVRACVCALRACALHILMHMYVSLSTILDVLINFLLTTLTCKAPSFHLHIHRKSPCMVFCDGAPLLDVVQGVVGISTGVLEDL